MTIAEMIAEEYGNDGQSWYAYCGRNKGRHLSDACHAAAVRTLRPAGDVAQWMFADGSVITAAGGAWDIGYAGCFCWRGAGHRPDCSEI